MEEMSGVTLDHEAVGAGVARAVAGVREALSHIDVGSLADADRLALVAELERLKGAASAVQARAVDAVRGSAGQGRSVGSQVALARREAPSLGDRFVGVARALVHELPHTMSALEAGVVGERHVVEVVRETAALTLPDRVEVDRRLAGVLGSLSWRAAGRAARRVAAELDAASVVARMERAVASRRVSVRPAPDGMAYLTVLGPLREVVGAYAAVQARARAVVAGGCPEEEPGGRGVGAVAADTALRLMAGLEVGQVQPVEVQLVMTDWALLGTGDPGAPVMAPARVPGHGSVPAPVARAWVREAGEGSVWLRRLYTRPGGRDLVAMDSRRRVFSGLLRRMLVLRDDVCVTPWCDAPVVHADHARPARAGGVTSLANGSGMCARCNLVKEEPGWRVTLVRESAREVEIVTPAGHGYRSLAPPLLGWGSDPPERRGEPGSALERRLEAMLGAA